MPFPRFRFHKPGTAPGTLFEPQSEAPRAQAKIRAIRYDGTSCDHFEQLRAEDLPGLVQPGKVTWIQIAGMEDPETARVIGQLFNLHALALEDLLNLGLRPKLDAYEDHYFITARSLQAARLDATVPENDGVCVRHVGLFFSAHWVITFHEGEGNLFAAIEQRLRTAKGRIRKAGTDYLAYAVLDLLTDNFFPTLEEFGRYLEELEEELLDGTNPSESLGSIHRTRRVLLDIRHAAWPMREIASGLARDEAKLIKRETRLFFRDVQDNLVQAIEMVETYREIANGLLEINLSKLSARTNEIIRVLTIVSTIFIPLTFLVGVYGMNFDYMPELRWKWSYPAIWVSFVLIAGGMLAAFKRRGWF
jgi:magnesium transporter